jgi:hypothetical protein
MSDWKEFIIPGLFSIATIYFITIFIFDLLLRGFSPFITSRPWVVEQIIRELTFEKKKPIMVAFSSGRSGFFNTLQIKFPDAVFIGIESEFFPYVVAKVQSFLRRTKIRVKYQPIHRVNIKEADLIYCHLEPDELRELSSKFKFECKPGALVISTGFNIPYLDPIKVVPLEDRSGKYDFFSKNQNLFQSKYKKFKKEKKAYIYEI